jgi:hypothetical protein
LNVDGDGTARNGDQVQTERSNVSNWGEAFVDLGQSTVALDACRIGTCLVDVPALRRRLLLPVGQVGE